MTPARMPVAKRRALAFVFTVMSLFVVCGCTNDNPVTRLRPDAEPHAPTATIAERLNSPRPAPSQTPVASGRTPGPTESSPRGDSSAWSEDFDGAAGTLPDPTLFSSQTGGNGWGNDERETYTNRAVNASLDGHGDLVLTMRRELFTGADGIARHYTSARLTTLGKWSFETGTLSARIKMPAGAGLWPAFWLVGSDIATVGWPACGEIDVVETLNSATTEYTSAHGPDASGKFWTVSTNTRAASGSFADGFHVYSVQRRPGSIVTSIDGKVIGELTPATLKAGERWVFDKPMAALFNVAVGGTWPGPPNAHTPASASMVVDWLRYTP